MSVLTNREQMGDCRVLVVKVGGRIRSSGVCRTGSEKPQFEKSHLKRHGVTEKKLQQLLAALNNTNTLDSSSPTAPLTTAVLPVA